MKTREDILNRIAEKQEEIKNLPLISLFTDDGDTDEDAYQAKLEQGWYKDELYNEIDQLNEELEEMCKDESKMDEENEIYEMCTA